MASGKLGSADLTANAWTIVYACPAFKVATANIRLANRAGIPQKVRVAVTPGAAAPVAADFIAYDPTVKANGVYEDTAIVIGPNERLQVFIPAGATVSCRVHGFEQDQ